MLNKQFKLEGKFEMVQVLKFKTKNFKFEG